MHDIEGLREKILSPEALFFVKNRLSDIQNNISFEGVIAGQSVASAVIEFLKLDNNITPVYNDIDQFIVVSKYYADAFFQNPRWVKFLPQETTPQPKIILLQSLDPDTNMYFTGAYPQGQQTS